ncbi:hypothetical protein C8Q80DRAFT_761411 [Daedaleopsis nitida]|nr:hypothetical protein C8Q80DRAFT_761411 [Daedaleopsis nitida]
MFTRSRTANNSAHGLRSVNPVFRLSKLHPKQRQRLDKSSKKVADLLGEMPIIDIVLASPKAGDVSFVSEVVEEKRGRKGGKAKAIVPPPPILRCRIAPVPSPRPSTPGPMGSLQVPGARPRKPVPNSLDLASPVWRTDAYPISPLRRQPGFLSPMSPLSPFSPIETSDMREERYHGLRRLARASRAFRETIIEELPANVHTAQHVDNLTTYLDLYRLTDREKRLTRDSDAYMAYSPIIDPNSVYTACSFDIRRRSASMSRIQRRGFHSRQSTTPVARTSFIMPHSATPASRTSFVLPHTAPYSASVYSQQERRSTRYTLVIDVPSPVTAAILQPPLSSRMSYTLVFDVPPKRADQAPVPETPADEDSPLQQQQKAARARAAMRPLLIAMDADVSLPDLSPSPTTPISTALSQMRSPRVPAPYWVRTSYRMTMSAHEYVRRTHSYARRSAARVPSTPRTIRRERRQGWGGEWKAGKLQEAVEGLKEIKTPAPPKEMA